jgi:hypothetical protein
MKNIILLTSEDETVAYNSLTTICKDFKQFSYHYLKRQKYPFRSKGYTFKKLQIKR